MLTSLLDGFKMTLTLVVLRAKWRVHDDRVKLLGVRGSNRANITLDHVNVRQFKILNISFEYVQGVFINVKSDTQSLRKDYSDADSYILESRVILHHGWKDGVGLTQHQALQLLQTAPHIHSPSLPLVYSVCHQMCCWWCTTYSLQWERTHRTTGWCLMP